MSAVTIYDFEQRSVEWYEARRGIVTASIVGKLITPAGLKVAANDTSRAIITELAAERITGHVEETRTTDDMWRGIFDEPIARNHYAEHNAPVVECGFMVADYGTYRLGFSPDGLVGDDGLIEVKSRKPHLHLAHVLEPAVPHVHMAQMQAGLMVSGRKFCDYISWAGGMPMWVVRVSPDPAWIAAIHAAVTTAENAIQGVIGRYEQAVKGLPATERVDHFADIEVRA